MKKIIDTKDLKDLQMEIADYVDEFCKKNNIKYSLACGTLIGAVRHGGFIPWDDDLDIMLLREDFNKLADLWDNSNSPFLFHCINKGNNQGLPYGKISNPLTVLDENDQRTMGVNIDVYPIDEVLDINDFNIRHKSVLDWYLEMSYVSRSLKGSLNTILRNIIRKIQHYPNTPNRIAKTINRIAESENGKGGIMLFEMVAGRGYKKPFLKESFSETVDIKFEDRVYQALKGYDEYLTSMFGDYMKLPPEEKRVSHHHFKAWYK